MLISKDSPLRTLPVELSRKQILIFDGIRYAAEMTEIAYQRLWGQLQTIFIDKGIGAHDIATAMLDAWSIIDSVHRFWDLISLAPGVPNGTWKPLLEKRTEIVRELRNCVQHQRKRRQIDDLIAARGQIWGYLSWAEVRDSHYTGKWFMISPGTAFDGDSWMFWGTGTSAPLPRGFVRLNAFGKRVYLGQCIQWIGDAVNSLTELFNNGSIHLIGNPAGKRTGRDWISEELIQIEYG